MATVIQRRRGTTAEHATFTGALGELTVDTTKATVVVHDGATAGGFPLMRQDFANATGQLAGMRNKIINGKMEIAQRGTSFAAIANDAYSLDRYQHVQSGAGVITASQQSDVPSSNEFQSSLRYAVTTADTSIAASDIYAVRQLVEGFNARDLIGRTFTLSFWVRSSKTGTHCVSVRNIGDRSYVAQYTVNAANTWEYKTVTVSGGLITAGTWNWTNGIGLGIAWALACGTTNQTTAGAWQTGSFFATSNQVNCLDSNTNIFAITGVQLEVGSAATPFEHRPYGVELALCQRYFHIFSEFNVEGYANAGATRAVSVPMPFPVQMRATPTRTVVTAGILTNVRASSTAWAGLGIEDLNRTFVSASVEAATAGLASTVNQTESFSAEL